MQDILDTFGAVFNFFENVRVGGMPIITWIVIALVFVAISFIVRGNKS